MNNQKKAPLLKALNELKNNKIVPFDVPGHKRGRGNPELREFLGEQCMSVDVNSMQCLDNLCHPTGVIMEAEKLCAEAFGAAHAFFMVGGTTSSVQAMILASVKRDEKIILPRNVHQSVINALILTGAVPVYINPSIDKTLGITLGMSLLDVKEAIEQNPEARAVLINNPTYYGICSDLSSITKLAHDNDMLVLVDEAHGTHFYFGDDMPVSAMSVGADMSSVSMHKSGGSLTQSSVLLCGENVNENHLRQIINLTQTTSASYLLLASLDISRRNLALDGRRIFEKVMNMAEYARGEINEIGDYYAYSRELINGDSIFDFDATKLSVNTLALGLAGVEVYDILRDEYDIQVEFGDVGNILAYISVGDKKKSIERFISALAQIKRHYKRERRGMIESEYISPLVAMSPQNAFYAEKKSVPLDRCIGAVSGEFVICYPPGIPVLAPGERITEQIVDYIHYTKDKGSKLTGPQSLDISELKVLL